MIKKEGLKKITQSFISALEANQERYRFATWIEFSYQSCSAEVVPLQVLLLKNDQRCYRGYYYALSRIGFYQLKDNSQYNNAIVSSKKGKYDYDDARLTTGYLSLPTVLVRKIFSYLLPDAKSFDDIWLMEKFRVRFGDELSHLDNRLFFDCFSLFNSPPSDVFIDLSSGKLGLGYPLEDRGLHLLLDFMASQNLKNINLTFDLKGCAVTDKAVLWFAKKLKTKVYNNLYCNLILNDSCFSQVNFLENLSAILYNGQYNRDDSLVYTKEEHSDTIILHVRFGGKTPNHAASEEKKSCSVPPMCSIM